MQSEEVTDPPATLHGGSYDGETVHTIVKTFLVPKRPHEKDDNGHWVFDKYVRRTDSADYDYAGLG